MPPMRFFVWLWHIHLISWKECSIAAKRQRCSNNPGQAFVKRQCRCQMDLQVKEFSPGRHAALHVFPIALLHRSKSTLVDQRIVDPGDLFSALQQPYALLLVEDRRAQGNVE